jgi:hypothetical protein
MSPDCEPPWAAFYTKAAFTADLGRCLRDLGEAEQAITLSAAAVRDYAPWRVRARCSAQNDLAVPTCWQVSGAGCCGGARCAALRTAAEVSSTRTLDRLRTLQRQVQPPRADSPHLRELDDRIIDLLTRSARPD